MEILLSLGSGVARSINSLQRKIASGHMSEVQMTFWLRFFTLIGMILLIIIFKTAVPSFTRWILLVIVTVGFIEGIATFYSFRAIKNGALSIVAPLEASTPLILIPLGFLLLGEKVNLYGMLAVSLLSAGVYLLLLKRGQSWTLPFKSLANDVVAFSVFIYAMLTALTIIGEKYLLEFMPVLWVLVVITATQVIVIPLYAKIAGEKIALPGNNYLAILLASLFTIISRALELMALGIAASSLVVGIRKIDTLITVTIANIKLHERLKLHQYVAVFLILVGIIFATIA